MTPGGPFFHRMAGSLQDRLAATSHAWERVELAHALWRVSGDHSDALPALLDQARADAPGGNWRARFIALEYLGHIGTPALSVLPTIDAFLDQDHRVLSGLGGRTGHELADDLHCQTIAMRARHRIAPPLR
ncbi:hypothetical protein NQK81_02460 [Amycolatopsis roodepoortensis]|uniref:hypothetical protein n=1 Tax=Amycolatopsis roodepoortensis TaxID=700274 RepID=UPI00214C5293|nr:hypothetical protein [Amycolatopsis roodepoortensis]UUV32336.1 hypothetical protein NQK81_02460 [Amycolatopsis roodepoortensis]